MDDYNDNLQALRALAQKPVVASDDDLPEPPPAHSRSKSLLLDIQSRRLIIRIAVAVCILVLTGPLMAKAYNSATASPDDGSQVAFDPGFMVATPDKPKGSPEPVADPGDVPYKNGTAEESYRGARMLYQNYVLSGNIVFSDQACAGTRSDFIKQRTSPNAYRGPGRATYIHPAIWRLLQVIADGQEKRGSPRPYVEVSCLASSHSIRTRGGGFSQHPVGKAVDISVIGGERVGITRAQYSGDRVSQAIKDLWADQLYSCQIISWHGRGGISDVINPSIYTESCPGFKAKGAFYMSNHGDHLHLSASLG